VDATVERVSSCRIREAKFGKTRVGAETVREWVKLHSPGTSDRHDFADVALILEQLCGVFWLSVASRSCPVASSV
jgi:hypothetical protein